MKCLIGGIILAMTVIMQFVAADSVYAGKMRGIHFSEEKAAKDAAKAEENRVKRTEAWEEKMEAWDARREEWRKNTEVFKEKVNQRKALRARKNQSSYQGTDYRSSN